LDERQQRFAEDLAGVFEGEIRFDDVAREIYSTDASLYQIRPFGVAYPKHHDDVELLAKYAGENDLPLIARGAGSGVAGGAIGSGLIVDFSRHMNQVLDIGSDTVRVQAGVVRDQLNRKLRKHGRYFAPDPSNSIVTTVGGMLAVDAAGSHAVRVGSTRDHVKAIRTVLINGTTIDAGTIDSPLDPPRDGEHKELIRQLAHVLARNDDLIRERQPPMIRNCSGYFVRSILHQDQLNLARMLVGSEGTLGLFTEAVLHTTPIPAHRGVALLVFGDLPHAIDAVNAVAQLQPSACDLLDRRVLSLAREADERFAVLIPPNAEAALLIEQTGYSDQQANIRLEEVIKAARTADASLSISAQSVDADDVDFLWSLPSRVVPLLIRLHGETRPVPIVEDIAVPPHALRDFLLKAQRVFQRHWVTASLYAHAASGQVHFRPFLSIPNSQNANMFESLARELYEVAIACGGTIAGEHGNGLSRTAFIRSQYGPLYKVFQQIKDLFDPHNLLNPGKIISDDPHLTIRNFRTSAIQPTEPGVELVPLQLNWDRKELLESAQRCNGCAGCRVDNQEERMCPFFHLDQEEENSPRSTANLIRAHALNTLDPKAFSTDQTKKLADSCFNCKQCQIECPSNVDIPSLALEAKAQVVAARGLTRADWILSRAHSFGRLGCSIAPLANWAIGNPAMRWLMEKGLGIARGRRLPRFARRPFIKRLPKSVKNANALSDPDAVVLFVDHFINYHDTELGTALIRILDHNGIPVFVPPNQTVSGMAMISAGDVDAARAIAETNIDALAEFARDGRRIITVEPTSALCLKHEYPRLLDHPDAAVVAEQVTDIGSFLQELDEQKKLQTDFNPLELKVAYHLPCHVKFLSQKSPLVAILNQIPNVTLNQIEKGCSGMAGAFGMTAANFETSIAIGQGLMTEMQRPDIQIGATECSSCQMQMQQQTTTPTLHPIKLLALAYGLMPEIEKRLTPKKWRLVQS